jgi:hypothetical protein
VVMSSVPPTNNRRSRRPGRDAVRRPILTPKWSFEGVYLRVGAIPASRVIVIERTAVHSGDADLAEVFGPAEDALRKVERGKFGLLVDVRLAPGRNDSEFEKAFQPYRQRLQRGFRRVAILVETTYGKLQCQRYAREDGAANCVFDDYATAVVWLDDTSGHLGR